jgi:ribosomal protein L11 methyltransferase
VPLEGGKIQAVAYFGDPLPPAAAALAAAVPLEGVELVAVSRMGEADWLAQFRSRSEPFAVGRTLWVDPGEPDRDPAGAAAPRGRHLLRLPARQAFGTGSHESTRLALELLEEMPVAGAAVLDVGTGTGILAFAALLAGAAAAVGCDLDPAAALHAGVNRSLNELRPRLFAGTLAALTPKARFDLALVNITPAVFLPELPRIRGLLRPAGRAIFSGVLTEQEEEVAVALTGGGFPPEASRRAGDWVALQSRVVAA